MLYNEFLKFRKTKNNPSKKTKKKISKQSGSSKLSYMVHSATESSSRWIEGFEFPSRKELIFERKLRKKAIREVSQTLNWNHTSSNVVYQRERSSKQEPYVRNQQNYVEEESETQNNCFHQVEDWSNHNMYNNTQELETFANEIQFIQPSPFKGEGNIYFPEYISNKSNVIYKKRMRGKRSRKFM